MIADLLHRIAERQAELNRILTGWYLTPDQIAAIFPDLAPHEPHPDVGGLGRLDSIPVFPVDDFPEPEGAIQTDACDGVRFTFVQMNIVN